MAPDTVRLWLGTSPDDRPDAVSGGIWSADLDRLTGRLDEPVLRARTPAPSFLALSADARSLFAAGETTPGAVTRFAIDADGGLRQVERVSSGGSGPCHLLVHPDGRALYVANYVSGSVGVLPLRVGTDGAQELVGGVAQVFEHSGRGPVTDRQDGPHAHSTLLSPDGAFLLACDLGTDEVRRYRVRPDGLLDADGVAFRLPPGTGPRHAAWGPGNHLYVTGELDATVHVLAWDGRALHPVAVVPVGPTAHAPDRASGAPGTQALPAHVVVHAGLVLASVRGPDVVAGWRPTDGGAHLTPAGRLDVGEGAAGAVWPRHFAVVPGPAGDWLVVAGQRADRLVVLGLGDVRTDVRPGEPVATGLLPAPTCVVEGRAGLPDPR